jgi:hypothetical protein
VNPAVIVAATDPAPLVVTDCAGHVHAAVILLNRNLTLRTSVRFSLLAKHVPFKVIVCLTNLSRMPALVAVFAETLLAIIANSNQLA